MSSSEVQIFLAKLYTDEQFLETYLKSKEQLIKKFSLTDFEKKEILSIDQEGLRLAFKSYQSKRKSRKHLPTHKFLFLKIKKLFQTFSNNL